jgi:hypothetical protein
MTKYQEFLNSVGIISEDLFDEIVNSLPNIDIIDIDFSDLYGLGSCDEISEYIINYKLNDWNYCYSENIDFENKTFELCDVESLEDLEEIKNFFSKWTITNYDELKETITESEEEDKKRDKIDKLIQEIRYKCDDIDKLEKFVNSL